jgi:hypothetical protein
MLNVATATNSPHSKRAAFKQAVLKRADLRLGIEPSPDCASHFLVLLVPITLMGASDVKPNSAAFDRVDLKRSANA